MKDPYMAVFEPFDAADWTLIPRAEIPTYQHRSTPSLQFRLQGYGQRCLFETRWPGRLESWSLSGELLGPPTIDTLAQALQAFDSPEIQHFQKTLALYCWNAHVRDVSLVRWRPESVEVFCAKTLDTLCTLPPSLAEEGKRLLNTYKYPLQRARMVLVPLVSITFSLPSSHHEALQMHADLERTTSCIKR